MISVEIVERLLFEAELDALDFKSEQYPFSSATDEDKSELLKDILAFTNSWRRSDGYVLIGVKEVKGEQAEVVGIATSLDDAHLQQFINGKTQRPFRFAYRELQIRGKKVGVIHIPLQERPVYSVSRYGKVDANVVYVRRGSSTAIAKPDEIAEMGRGTQVQTPEVLLDVYFAEPTSRTRVTPTISSLVLDIPAVESIPDYRTKPPDPFGRTMGIYERSEYYRELAQFTKVDRLVQPIWLAISNQGTSAAFDVRIEVSIPGLNGAITVLGADAYPGVPRMQTHPMYMTMQPQAVRRAASLQVHRIGGDWTASARVEKVQPKFTKLLDDPIYLGTDLSTEILCSVTAYADNLPAPHCQVLTVSAETSRRSVSLQDILELERERFGDSPAFKQFMEDHGYRNK